MAIFSKGIKMGKFDVRLGLSKERGQGIMRKLGILESPKKPVRPGGEIDAIRSVVGKGEGFMFPCNFKVVFNCPKGIIQPTWGGDEIGWSIGEGSGSTIKGGGLDWQTHKLQRTTQTELKSLFKDANPTGQSTYQPFKTTQEKGLLDKKLNPKDDGNSGPNGGGERLVRKLDLYCSKVSIPEKTINVGLYRHYGEPFPFPQSIQYGTITTTFYCDSVMTIKRFFDAWQKLIINDMTGNFNYMDEYQSDFNVYTRSTISRASLKGASDTGSMVTPPAKEDAKSFPGNISSMIKDATAKFNELTGVPDPPSNKNASNHGSVPAVTFADTYGIKVFNCWPQTVGSIDLSHDATDQIGTFDVTWAYTKWSPFKMGNLGNRSEVNLSIGEFRNEKDGFPFLEDLPAELSGPLTGAVNQGIVTSPLSKASNLLG